MNTPHRPRPLQRSGRGAAGFLSLAAAPTFAFMALVTAVGGGPLDICSASSPSSVMGGMVPMYVLMSAFHLAPWLRLASSRHRVPTADGLSRSP